MFFICKYKFSVKIYFLRIRLQNFCTKSADFAAKLLTGLNYCHSGGVSCGWGIRAGIIWRNICIYPKHNNIIYWSFHTVSCHLGKNGITAGTHIRTSKSQCIGTVFIQLHICAAHVNSCNRGTLHGHGNTYSADFSISKILTGIFFIPVHHFLCPFHTLIHGTAFCCITISVCRKRLSLKRHVQLPDLYRIHSHDLSQLVHCWFNCIDSLCCSVSTVRSCCLYIGINNIIGKTISFRMTIKGNGFMPA